MRSLKCLLEVGLCAIRHRWRCDNIEVMCGGITNHCVVKNGCSDIAWIVGYIHVHSKEDCLCAPIVLDRGRAFRLIQVDAIRSDCRNPAIGVQSTLREFVRVGLLNWCRARSAGIVCQHVAKIASCHRSDEGRILVSITRESARLSHVVCSLHAETLRDREPSNSCSGPDP